MSTVFNPIGTLIFVLMVVAFARAARNCALGALSLPCITLLTSMIYFYLMPLLWLTGNNVSFFGLNLQNLDPMHYAVGLYMLGAFIAFGLGSRTLASDPLQPTKTECAINPLMFWSIFLIAIAGVAAKIVLGALNFSGDPGADMGQASNVNFLQLTDSLLITLTIVFLIRQDFRPRALALLAFTTLIFLTDGFRFRLVILFSATVIAFALTRRIRIRTTYVVAGGVIGVALLNAIGMTRRYGSGLDLTRLQDTNWADLFQSFGAEIGPTFVLMHLTNNPPRLIGFDPWIIAVSRLIPSFLWTDKPYPLYLQYYPGGFPDPNALLAGIAGTQQAEFFLQFGWVGLPILAALFFSLALWIQRRVYHLSPEGRIAGIAIIPALFGFYAQQRGYTFQLVCEILFTLSPLFLIHIGGRRRTVAPARSVEVTSPGGQVPSMPIIKTQI